MLANNCSNDGDLRFSPLNSRILQICAEDKWSDICAKPDSNQWGENEARVACHQMGMIWKEGSGINCFGIKLIPFFYSDIELKVTGRSYQTYLVLFKNFSCSGTEEKLLNCSTIRVEKNEISSYDCIYQPNVYYYATIDCIPGIYSIKPIYS